MIGYFANPIATCTWAATPASRARPARRTRSTAYNGIKAAIQAIEPGRHRSTSCRASPAPAPTAASCCTTVDPAAVAAAGRLRRRRRVRRHRLAAPPDRGPRPHRARAPGRAGLADQPGRGREPEHDRLHGDDRPGGRVRVRATTPAILWSSYNGAAAGQRAGRRAARQGRTPAGTCRSPGTPTQASIPAITDYTIRPTATTTGRTYMYFTGAVTYPFGYGLSYDTFSFSNLQVNKSAARRRRHPHGQRRHHQQRAPPTGQTVPQLYVTTPFEPASAQDPAKRLEAFQKVSLAAGQTKTVTFTVPVSKLAFYDTASNTYIVDPGSYGLQVSSSAADSDVQLSSTVAISGTICSRRRRHSPPSRSRPATLRTTSRNG